MNNKIKEFSYVTMRNGIGYYFVESMTENIASIIGMKLSEMKDTIIFYSRLVNIDKLEFVDESFININGPLSILRCNLRDGIDDVFIEGRYA